MGVTEMTQWLRGLAVLPEDPGSIPRTNVEAHTMHNSISRDPILSCSLQGQKTHTHGTRTNTYTHKIKINKSIYKDLKEIIQ